MGIADKIFGSARDRFGKEVAARVLALDTVARTEYDAEKFQVLVFRTPDDDSPAVINLDRTFQETERAPASARKAAVGRLVDAAALPPTPDTWERAQPMVRPVLRPPVHDPKIGIVSRPALRYLAEMLVLDSPSAMKYVGPDDLATWGVGAEEAFDAAHRNLARSVTHTLDAARLRAGSPAATRLDDSGDHYITSLPLVDGWLATLQRIAEARPLAFPTSNSVLLLAYETADPDEIAIRVQTAEREWTESARPICPAPITVGDDGTVTLYEPPPDHPAHAAVKHATILLAMSSYGPQTEYLRDAAGAEDPFPAALKGFRSPTGEEFTGTTWTDGIESMLPQADLVFFPKEGEQMVQIPWAVVAEEAGLTPAEGFHPARYHVGSWPAAEVMERMKARASAALV
ncbi:hypothetical protein [Catenulispora subtropica]|uniref:Uncharacterized protein n=1 Tax=Catenulispora subtropica TaxID=450798 RepID=A0ABN2T6U1_9ACTN